MILDQNDPTGLGLFSRCARNQACKTTKSRPATAGSRKQLVSQIKIHQSKRKNTINDNWFNKQQSRDQRQRKYKQQITPAVGQYNPIVKQKAKLVWDVIKIYQKKNKQLKKLSQIKNKLSNQQNQHTNIETNTNTFNNKQQSKITNKTINNRSFHKDKQSNHKSQRNINQSIQHNNANSDIQLNNNSNNIKFYTTNNNTEQTILDQDRSLSNTLSKNRNNTSMSHKSTCMVNMSRMTGRINKFTEVGKVSLMLDQSNTIMDMSTLNKSLQKIKPKTTKNFYFKRMIGRKEQYKSTGTANIYDCKVDLIKPRNSAQLNFALSKGRQQFPKKSGDNSVYSYTHYDYNQYVWRSTSSVFANTKKNLISFEKQK